MARSTCNLTSNSFGRPASDAAFQSLQAGGRIANCLLTDTVPVPIPVPATSTSVREVLTAFTVVGPFSFVAEFPGSLLVEVVGGGGGGGGAAFGDAGVSLAGGGGAAGIAHAKAL